MLTYQNGCKISESIFVDNSVPERRDSPPVLLKKYLWSPRLGEVWIWVNTLFFHSCQRAKITRAPCRRRIGGAVPCAEKFGDLITADHRVLTESCESRSNHRFAIVVQDLATQWIQSYPRKTNTSRKHRGACKNSWSQIGSQKSFTQKFLGIWKSLWRCFLESLRVYTTPIGDLWYFGKSSAQSKGRHLCCIVATGPNESWWAD